MGFLDNYEGNKERTDRWIKTYPEGRLEATIVNFDPEKQQSLAMCQVTKQPMKQKCQAHHHLDHPRKHQLHQNADMGQCAGIKASQRHQKFGLVISAHTKTKKVNAHRVGMYYAAQANGSHRYERLC
jgi:hypothetical protein